MEKENNSEEKTPMKGERVEEILEKEIKSFGRNAAHITGISARHVGKIARVQIVSKWMMCRRCSETFTDQAFFSPDDRYCRFCFEGLKKLNELKKKNKLACEVCKKKITEAEFRNAWDRAICESCWIEEAEAESVKEQLKEGEVSYEE